MRPNYKQFLLLCLILIASNVWNVDEIAKQSFADVESKSSESSKTQWTNHTHNDTDPNCILDVSDMILETWKQGARKVCETNKSVYIEEYVLQPWEYAPVFFRYKNVETMSFGGPLLGTGCPSNTTIKTEKDHNFKPAWATYVPPIKDEESIVNINTTVIRVGNFGESNAYERFHAYLNVMMTMKILNITDPQLVVKSDNIVPNHHEMWSVFSKFEPIYSTENSAEARNSSTRYQFTDLIDASTAASSMLCTKSTNGGLRGRGTDHHCKSNLYREMIEWIRSNFGITERQERNNVTQIIWSSREPYIQQQDVTKTPKRAITDEKRLVEQIQANLGKGYKIKIVNFGRISSYEAIKLASESDIMVGVHGAALVHASFLPRHSLLIEIFGGDRGPVNRHYHNIASLADIHYFQLSMGGSSSWLKWTSNTVSDITNAIKNTEIKIEDIEPKRRR